MIGRAYLAYLLIAVLMTAPAACYSEKAVQVFLGKQPLELLDSVPAILSMDVYVPIRPFAEALGANVNWDGASGTLTISSVLGTSVLRVGSRTATVRGTRISFPDAPYIHDGQMFGPILFFNEAFNQAWYWDPYSRKFRWIPIFPRFRGGLSQPPVIIPGPGRATTVVPSDAPLIPSTRIVVGEVIRTVPVADSPRIVVRTGGRTITYPIAYGASISRGAVGDVGREVGLGSVRPGDRATLTFNDQDMAETIKAQFRTHSGRVRSITSTTLTLDNLDNIRIGPQTVVITPENLQGSLEDVIAGDQVLVSSSPITGRASLIQILPQVVTAEADAPDDQISLNTTGPLRPGDTLRVRFRGHEGGQAWFTLPGAAANVAMPEISPGVYLGQYTVRQGDMVVRQPVKVTFITPDGASFVRQSQRTVTAQTVAGYLPRITSPHQGDTISSPVVVHGVAAPGSRVRVVIEFRRHAQRILPLAGTTAVEDVRADADGRWQTSPLAAVAPFSDREPGLQADYGIFSDLFRFEPEPPTVYTITAISIGVGGEETSAYSIQVFKRPEGRIGGLPSPVVELNTRSGV